LFTENGDVCHDVTSLPASYVKY